MKTIKRLQTWLFIYRQFLPNVLKTLKKRSSKLDPYSIPWRLCNATNQLSTANNSARSTTNSMAIASAATSPTRSKASSMDTVTVTARLLRQRCTTQPMPTAVSANLHHRRRKEVCSTRSRKPFLMTVVTVTMKVTKPTTKGRQVFFIIFKHHLYSATIQLSLIQI